MQAKDAITSIINDSGMSRYAVAKAMGRNENFIYTLMKRPTQPSYGVITEVADICGYDLALVKRDGTRTILLDRPEK